MIFSNVEDLLRRKIGLDPTSIGSKAIERAVRERGAARNMADAERYLSLLHDSPEEQQALFETVVVNETWFFRDREAFQALTRMAREEWLPNHPSGILRVLSLPCSTGEEPYSAAMALLEANLPPDRFYIDAVDISARVLQQAQRGIYGRNSFRGSDLGFRARHFSAGAQGMVLGEAVRCQVRFQQGNLLEPGFMEGAQRYDAIFCRNLLIYFDRETQVQAVGILGKLLAENGMLFVGPSETGLLLGLGLVSARVPLAFAFRHPSVAKEAVQRSAPAIPKPAPTRRNLPARGEPPPRPPRTAEVDPASPVSTLSDAERLADLGRLTEAAQLCLGYLREQGASAQAFYLMGLIREAEARPSEAEQFYRKALYLDHTHREALSHLALLLERQGEPEAADRVRARRRRLDADQEGSL